MKKYIAMTLALVLLLLAACGTTGDGAAEHDEHAQASNQIEETPATLPESEPISLTTENISEYLDFNVSFQNYIETTDSYLGIRYIRATADLVLESRRLRDVTFENVSVTIEAVTNRQLALDSPLTLDKWNDVTIEMKISFDGVGTGRSQIRHNDVTFDAKPPSSARLEIISVTGYVIEN